MAIDAVAKKTAGNYPGSFSRFFNGTKIRSMREAGFQLKVSHRDR